MKVTRSILKDGNLNPPVFNILRTQILPADVLHHTSHRLLHPQAIYSISLARVTQAFTGVLDARDAVDTTLVNADGQLDFDASTLLKAQEELLEALLSHVDDCYHILKALHPPTDMKRPPREADKWLHEAKHPTVSAFTQNILPYRKAFAPIVNRIKHEHGRLRSVVFFGTRSRVPGYFVEGVNTLEQDGPDPVIHPDNTALSFNRDLRFHFVWLYLVGVHLQQAILGALKKQYQLQLPIQRVEDQDVRTQKELWRIAERISTLPFQFFPDEVQKPTPVVDIQKTDTDTELTLVYPSPTRAFGPTRGMRIQAIWSGDSVTRSWRLPYLKWPTE